MDIQQVPSLPWRPRRFCKAHRTTILPAAILLSILLHTSLPGFWGPRPPLWLLSLRPPVSEHYPPSRQFPVICPEHGLVCLWALPAMCRWLRDSRFAPCARSPPNLPVWPGGPLLLREPVAQDSPTSSTHSSHRLAPQDSQHVV